LLLGDDKDKLEGEDKEKTEKAVLAPLDRRDENQLAEKDEFEQKEPEGTAEGGADDDRNEEYLEELGRYYADNDGEGIDPVVLLAMRDEAGALTELRKEETIREMIIRREEDIAYDYEFVRLFGLLEYVCDRTGLTFSGKSSTTSTPWAMSG